VYLLQDYCRRLGIGTTAAEIRELAASLRALPPDHTLAPLLRKAPDFRDDAGVADALLTKTIDLMNPILFKRSITAVALGIGALASNTTVAGGISLYEVGTADVGLASAGYSARAQDASTVFTNPAGMTRLSGDQLTLGAQLLYGDLGFSIG